MKIVQVEHLCKEFKIRSCTREERFFSSLFSRQYEIKKAVDDVSFSIDKGEIIGYLGPNGAGKSTTIKMLTGILTPTSGEIVSNGLVPYQNRKEYVKRIGVVFGQRTQLWWDIPVYESLNLMKDMYHIPEQDFKKNIDLFGDILKIHEFSAMPVRQLSLGQRMRADLCVSLLHNPDIVFLDEPTIGLDAIAKKSIRKFIREINREKKTTIMLTTHDMADIEKLCSRVIVIDHGKAVYDGSLEQVKKQFGYMERMMINLEQSLEDCGFLYTLGVKKIIQHDHGLELRYDRNQIKSSELIQALMNKSNIQDIRIIETEVEEAIRNMYLADPDSNIHSGV